MKRGSESALFLHNANSGFTLLEILVAVTVLAISFTALSRLYGGSLRSIENTEKYARATVLAEDKMNQLLQTVPFPPSSGDGVFEKNPGFRWKTEIAEYTGPIGRQGITPIATERLITRNLTVTVMWDEGNTPRSLSLETLKTAVEETR